MTLFDFLRWCFESGWRFVGLLLLVGMFGHVVAKTILAIRGKNIAL